MARALLRAHHDALLAVDQDYAREIMSTTADQAEKREELHAEYRGLRRVMAKLKSWVNEADIIRSNEEK